MIINVNKAIARYDMLPNSQEVTVALSGGADSVALLYAMREIAEKYNIRLKAAHLNHLLRGEEANRDEQFCKDLCEKLGVALTVERIDINAIAKQTGESTELCARNQRYAFLQRAAGENGKIATAHTADDNLETVIFNLVRGTGVAGLGGIPPVRDNIIRPLIFCTREQIEEYLEQKGQSFCTDSTNSDEVYTRNFIRHSIVPKLEELNPAVKQSVAKMCDGIRADNEFITKSARELIDKGTEVENLANADKSVSSAAVAMLCKENLGITPERKTVEAILDMLKTRKGKLNFEGNSFAEIENGKLCFYKLDNREIRCALAEVIGKKLRQYDFSVVTKDEFQQIRNVNKKFFFMSLDYDKIPKDAILHNYDGSGNIRIAGRNCSKSIGKLLNEYKVPERKKGETLVISDSCGPIAVLDYAVSERVKIDGETKTVLLIKKEESL
ncbi:MAG: tRNA lysidine(34) synthetase TilS [Clostridia bacterium]|nr:tRNA lysidine(34) synthetase TilS [Clostridia bacterium]